MKKKPTADSKKTVANKTAGDAKSAAKNSAKKAAPAKEIPHVVPKSKMEAKTKKEFKLLLFKLRERITGQIAALKDESLSRDDVVDLAEDGTDAFDRQFALNLVSSEQDAVFEIDEALQRLVDGTYGLCNQCFKTVDISRLRALPFVKLCVACQSAAEKNKPKFRALQELKGL